MKGRFERAQLLVGIRVVRIDDGAARQHENGGLEGAVTVEVRAAGHAAGVVRDDAADRARALAGGVGAELALVRGEARIDGTHRGAGLHAYPQAAVEHVDVAEIAPGVDEDSGG
ncbi:hypothetical protein D9M73_277200 [compost metagenome]